MAELCQRAPTRHSCRLPLPPLPVILADLCQPLFRAKKGAPPPGEDRGAGGGALGYIRLRDRRRGVARRVNWAMRYTGAL
jgi:hypothetical protein